MVWLSRRKGKHKLNSSSISFCFDLSQCCVCRIQLVPPTVAIKIEDRNKILIRRNIDIPKGSRCCKDHTSKGYLLHDGFFKLPAYKNEYKIFDSSCIINTMQELRTVINSYKHIDFDDAVSLSDNDYKNLMGFTRAQYDRILTYIPTTSLRNSINRSPRCALACLLMKLRLGVSNSVLASILGIDNKRKVSDIVHSTRTALMRYFVPHYLGLAHITRQEVINSHTSSIANRLLSENQNSCILVVDGTYLYIQVRVIFDFLSNFKRFPLTNRKAAITKCSEELSTCTSTVHSSSPWLWLLLQAI